MDAIEDIYRNDVYHPFIQYCRQHHYQKMVDLRRCSFERLANVPGITHNLLLRIKTLFAAYCKKHPDVLIGSAPSRSRASRAAAPAPDLGVRLQAHFQAHAGCLIRITDICKALSAKRGDVLKVLESAPWCKAVDSTTFFYVTEE